MESGSLLKWVDMTVWSSRTHIPVFNNFCLIWPPPKIQLYIAKYICKKKKKKVITHLFTERIEEVRLIVQAVCLTSYFSTCPSELCVDPGSSQHFLSCRVDRCLTYVPRVLLPSCSFGSWIYCSKVDRHRLALLHSTALWIKLNYMSSLSPRRGFVMNID